MKILYSCSFSKTSCVNGVQDYGATELTLMLYLARIRSASCLVRSIHGAFAGTIGGIPARMPCKCTHG